MALPVKIYYRGYQKIVKSMRWFVMRLFLVKKCSYSFNSAYPRCLLGRLASCFSKQMEVISSKSVSREASARGLSNFVPGSAELIESGIAMTFLTYLTSNSKRYIDISVNWPINRITLCSERWINRCCHQQQWARLLTLRNLDTAIFVALFPSKG